MIQAVALKRLSDDLRRAMGANPHASFAEVIEALALIASDNAAAEAAIEIEAAVADRMADFWAAVAARPDDGTTYADQAQARQIEQEVRDAYA